MPATTSYKRGDVVLIHFPFTDLSNSKQRPAVVVSSDQSNAISEDLLLAAITSQVPARFAADEYLIPAQDLARCGLPKPSISRVAKLVTLHRNLVIKQIGRLPSESLERVISLIRALF
jgi:mRNA interferase MazF